MIKYTKLDNIFWDFDKERIIWVISDRADKTGNVTHANAELYSLEDAVTVFIDHHKN